MKSMTVFDSLLRVRRSSLDRKGDVYKRQVLGHNLRRTLLHIVHMDQQLVELRSQIPLQILALRHAGGYELIAGAL